MDAQLWSLKELGCKLFFKTICHLLFMFTKKFTFNLIYIMTTCSYNRQPRSHPVVEQHFQPLVARHKCKVIAEVAWREATCLKQRWSDLDSLQFLSERLAMICKRRHVSKTHLRCSFLQYRTQLSCLSSWLYSGYVSI